MLNAEQIIEQGLIKTKNSKGKPAQVGYDLSAKSINAIGKDQLIKPAIGMVLKDKTILNTYTPVPLTKIDGVKDGYYIQEHTILHSMKDVKFQQIA